MLQSPDLQKSAVSTSTDSFGIANFEKSVQSFAKWPTGRKIIHQLSWDRLGRNSARFGKFARASNEKAKERHRKYNGKAKQRQRQRQQGRQGRMNPFLRIKIGVSKNGFFEKVVSLFFMGGPVPNRGRNPYVSSPVDRPQNRQKPMIRKALGAQIRPEP